MVKQIHLTLFPSDFRNSTPSTTTSSSSLFKIQAGWGSESKLSGSIHFQLSDHQFIHSIHYISLSFTGIGTLFWPHGHQHDQDQLSCPFQQKETIPLIHLEQQLSIPTTTALTETHLDLTNGHKTSNPSLNHRHTIHPINTSNNNYVITHKSLMTPRSSHTNEDSNSNANYNHRHTIPHSSTIPKNNNTNKDINSSSSNNQNNLSNFQTSSREDNHFIFKNDHIIDSISFNFKLPSRGLPPSVQGDPKHCIAYSLTAMAISHSGDVLSTTTAPVQIYMPDSAIKRSLASTSSYSFKSHDPNVAYSYDIKIKQRAVTPASYILIDFHIHSFEEHLDEEHSVEMNLTSWCEYKGTKSRLSCIERSQTLDETFGFVEFKRGASDFQYSKTYSLFVNPDLAKASVSGPMVSVTNMLHILVRCKDNLFEHSVPINIVPVSSENSDRMFSSFPCHTVMFENGTSNQEELQQLDPRYQASILARKKSDGSESIVSKLDQLMSDLQYTIETNQGYSPPLSPCSSDDESELPFSSASGVIAIHNPLKNESTENNVRSHGTVISDDDDKNENHKTATATAAVNLESQSSDNSKLLSNSLNTITPGSSEVLGKRLNRRRSNTHSLYIQTKSLRSGSSPSSCSPNHTPSSADISSNSSLLSSTHQDNNKKPFYGKPKTLKSSHRMTNQKHLHATTSTTTSSQLYTPFSPVSPTTAMVQSVVKSVYKKQKQEDMVLSPGDVVMVKKLFGDGWAWGYNLNSQSHGTFPLKCLEH